VGTAALLIECFGKAPECPAGSYFGDRSHIPSIFLLKELEGILPKRAVYKTFNECGQRFVAYCKQSLHSISRPYQILEIGAGTGGTSSAFFLQLSSISTVH